ncbi:MAG: polysaccharide ABC transporter ATP-binding protein [Chlamydiales bacterium]|nr:polysaccharide ABC transporter ATP-binding protein [Chlamydiales bacterium]
MTKAIEARNLSKRYRISHERSAMYDTMRETLSRGAKRLVRSILRRPSNEQTLEDLWVLRDVSFAIEPGTKVGIIGRNGAGKSTLLKVLSRITYPTSGEVAIQGRVASLLEVGTGFHPELTGKENIFLNGSILGMTKTEIRNKFDEMVAFSELEKFLDTPVKRYSSGMTARLAFAVAAHLDPDILIVDEVLSVGDYSFRDKCLNKMGEISQQGRTVLFVSHNMNTVLSLCDRALYLEKGRLITYDTVDNVVSKYMHQQADKQAAWVGEVGDASCRIQKAQVSDPDTSLAKDFFYCGDSVRIAINYEMVQTARDLVLGVSICTPRGLCLANAWLSPQQREHSEAFSQGPHTLALEFDSSMFYEGEYLVKVELKHIHGRVLSADEVVMKFSLYQSNEPNCLEWDAPCVVLGKQWMVESPSLLQMTH